VGEHIQVRKPGAVAWQTAAVKVSVACAVLAFAHRLVLACAVLACTVLACAVLVGFCRQACASIHWAPCSCALVCCPQTLLYNCPLIQLKDRAQNSVFPSHLLPHTCCTSTGIQR
jgi:hypothetical protein